MLNVIGRSKELFTDDLLKVEAQLCEQVAGSSFLVIGAAGSIGQAVSKEIFRRDPKLLHLVDISENNLVELVRDLRSSIGNGSGEFKTFAVDCGTLEFNSLFRNEGPYDYVLNLSALKHVRSEKDPYTLMRMTIVNVLNTIQTVQLAKRFGAKKYFCVSTDKAANPVNMMGASKRIMEQFLTRESHEQNISMARFANVAFSDGSLLHGFNQRIQKNQPITAPYDVRRYFLTPQEAGQLCLISTIMGKNREILFPKLSDNLPLTTFSDIAVRFLKERGLNVEKCESEEEARKKMFSYTFENKYWPCYFFESDTTGEKDFEEFYTNDEVVNLTRFSSIGVVENTVSYSSVELDDFVNKINSFRESGYWTREDLVAAYCKILPNFNHKETGKFLDERM